jgi:hypothetical protein
MTFLGEREAVVIKSVLARCLSLFPGPATLTKSVRMATSFWPATRKTSAAEVHGRKLLC